MELRHLRTFLAVLDEGSVSGGARRLFTTQPAVTRQMQALERHCGKPLLDRTRTGVAPTAAGLVLAQEARRLLASADRLASRLAHVDPGSEQSDAGLLRVGVMDGGCAELTPLIVQAARAAAVGSHVSVRGLALDRVADAVQAGTADVIMATFPLPMSGLATVPLFADRRWLMLPTQHRLANCARVLTAQVVDEVYLDERSVPTEFSDFFCLNDVRGAAPARRAEPSRHVSPHGVMTAVAHGEGAMTVTESFVRHHKHPGISFVPLVDAPRAAIGLAHRSGDERPAVRAFIAAAEEVARECVALVPNAVSMTSAVVRTDTWPSAQSA